MGTQQPAEIERDESLVAALWAVIAPRVARCSASFDVLGERLREGAAPPTPAELQDAARETTALGWLLGCVAEGLDSSLFAERREVGGLAWLLGLLREASARRGRQVRVAAPESSAADEPSRAESWACAEVLWAASERCAEPLEGRIERRGERWRLSCAGPLDAAVVQRATLWSGHAPSADGARWTWIIACRETRESAG